VWFARSLCGLPVVGSLVVCWAWFHSRPVVPRVIVCGA
jgi:hypothetical protein